MSERMSKIQEKNERYDSIEAWRTEAKRRFGEDPLDWRFVCPSCGHEQSVRDYKEADAPSTVVAFSCIGRFMDDSMEAFGGDGGPCNYAGGGLFRLNPVTIATPDGDRSMFAFAEPKEDEPEATEHNSGGPCTCCGKPCHVNGWCYECKDFPDQSKCHKCEGTWCKCWTCAKHKAGA